ncbi:STRAP [Mytilus edulis]|uniref:STRAP n=1 Tax=Mytilus edulis TaxID=6550 RepID=A0A8S3QPN6_MYTED|nr:STRAP [Mytilus edulis]
MWTVCLLLYTVAALLFSVQGICLTWNATKDNAFLECQVLGDVSIESQIQLMDSDDQIRVKCFIYDSPYCVAREEGDIVFGEASNNGFKLVFQTTTKNVQGIWKCVHGRESTNMHIDLSKGIMYSPEIHLSGEIKAHSKITLTCYSCTIPDTKSAYLFVNSVLEDVVRLHEGKCYRKRRQCSQTECSCSTEGNYFT